MEARRGRAREQFPQVLLAVLGIIQALALELLWERGVGGLDRWRALGAAPAGVLQVLATFLGIALIWVNFATLVLRYRWLPRFRDLLAPFVLGGLEFMAIERMAPERLPLWFGLMALIFVAVSFTTYMTFESAMAEDDLGEGRRLADHLGSFLPTLTITAFLLLCALAAFWRGPDSATALAALGLANAGMGVQLYFVRLFWYRDLLGG